MLASRRGGRFFRTARSASLPPEDDHKLRHWKTEVVAASVEMLSGRRKKDYAVESAAESLQAQAQKMGIDPVDGAEADAFAAASAEGTSDEEQEAAEALAA